MTGRRAPLAAPPPPDTTAATSWRRVPTATIAAALLPGTGHLLLHHRRAGAAILGVFGLTVAALVAVGPRSAPAGAQVLGVAVVAALCVGVTAPLALIATLANSQRVLLGTLFGGAGGTPIADAIRQPRLTVLLVGSDAGLNLLHQTVGYMMGIPLDYYVEVDMAGFAAIIDALGGVTADVGPTPLPIGGVLPDGTHVTPDGYLPAGVHHLDGNQALWFARSRRDADDYARMSRQRCLLQDLRDQKSPADVLTHFQAIAAATAGTVTTNIPQQILPALVSLASQRLTVHGIHSQLP